MELEDIATKHPTVKRVAEGYAKNEKMANMLLQLRDMGGMKVLIEQLEKMIEAINEDLTYSEKSTDLERATMFERRNCWTWLLDQFDSQNIILENINKFKEKYD